MSQKKNSNRLYGFSIVLLLSLFLLCCVSLGYFIYLMHDKGKDSSQAAVSEPSESVPSETDSETESETPTEEAPREYDISLMALGDNLMHMGIVGTGKQADGSYNYDFLFEGISDLVNASDIRVINQETILAGNDLGFSGYPHFNSPTEVGDAIADAGFNVVLQASNHSIDKELDGLISCANFWTEKHPEVLMTGIHATTDPYEIPVLTIEDVRFAILNYTYAPNLGAIPEYLRGHLNILCDYNESGKINYSALHPQVIEDIHAAREVADIVIVFPHWGNEYHTEQSSVQERFAREMAAAGADLIIGTHPHVPQPVEWVTADNGNRALCYYSLGNYVSTQKNTICMLEEMAWVTFHVTEDQITISEERTGVIPMVCHYKNSTHLQQVYLLEDYTEELASTHGIIKYGGVAFHLNDLQNSANEIFGDWILKRSDVLSPLHSDTPEYE